MTRLEQPGEGAQFKVVLGETLYCLHNIFTNKVHRYLVFQIFGPFRISCINNLLGIHLIR